MTATEELRGAFCPRWAWISAHARVRHRGHWELAGSPPDDEAVRVGVDVVLPGRPNSASERLRDGTTATAQGHVTGAHEFLTVEITGIRELYFEEGELMTSRGAFEPTPLETEAGFGDQPTG